MAQASSLTRTLTKLRPGDHLCSIYSNEDARRLVLTEFLRQGFTQNEKVFYLFDVDSEPEASSELAAAGLDVAHHASRGQLTLISTREAYLTEGRFDGARMIAWLRRETERAVAEGYAALRVAGEMAWILRALPDPRAIVEYEARLNDFFAHHPCVALCQYDKHRFPSEVLLNVLRSHPKAMIDAEFYDNFYYIPPHELLGGDLSAVVLRHWISHIEDHKWMMATLAHERDFLRGITEASPMCITVTDLQGHIVFANAQAERVLGLEREQIKDRTYNSPAWHITDYEGRPVPDEALPFQRVMAAGEPVLDVRHAIEWPDGRRVLLSVSGAPLFDGAGRVSRIVFVIEDVTKQVRDERALSWAVDVNAALAELSRALLASTSLEDISALVLEQAKGLTNSRWGYVGYVDPQTGHLVCPTMTTDVWDVCEVPGKDIIFEEFTGLWGWVLRNKKSLLTNAPAEDPRSVGTPPGHVSIERFLSAPALIGGELVGQVALADAGRDYGARELELVERLAALYALAVQRRRTESALQRSERKYRNLFEHANDSIFIVDPQTLRFLEVNEKAAQRLGYEREELLAMTVGDISAPGDGPIEAQVSELREHGSVVFEHVHRRKDGSVMPVEISSRLVDYEGQTVIQSLVRDITERKQAEEARQREIQSLQLLSDAPRAGVTAEMFGLLPLRESAPDLFADLVGQYGDLLDRALEERMYKVAHDISEQLRPMAEHLGFLRVGPRDVVEIHLTALREKSQGVPAPKAQAYAEEGRMLVLELMGHLVTHYRNFGGGLMPVVTSYSREGGRGEG